MEKEYNLLTRKLLAQGYTAENHPKYVYVGKSGQEKDNPLMNFYGGFEYYRWYVSEKVFKTPCGLQCKGTSCMTGLYTAGVEFTFENDMATVACPYDKKNCLKKSPHLRGTGAVNNRCNVHMTDEEYRYEDSVEGILKLEDDRIRREKISFSLMHNGRTCDNHMRYDKGKREWVMHYDPCQCANMKCQGHYGKAYEDGRRLFCPILGKPLDPKKGNVYYDIKTRYRRYDLDGTLFEGQVDTSIQKGVRFLQHPVSMDICRNIAKFCQDEIKWHVEMKYHQELFFAEYHGREFSVEVLNIRAEQRESRDLMQDLQDIRDGIEIMHASDQEKHQAAVKKERRLQAKEKRINAIEKKILKTGYYNMDPIDKRRADKLLEADRIYELEDLREENLRKEQKIPVQLSLFNLMDKEGDG